MKFILAALLLTTLAQAQVQPSKTILSCSIMGLMDGPEYTLKADKGFSVSNGGWDSRYSLKDSPSQLTGGILKRTEVLTMKGESPVQTEAEEKLVRIVEKSGKYEMLINLSNSLTFEGEVSVQGKLIKGGMNLGDTEMTDLSCFILSQEDFANLSNL
jgi:hypothetical protein